jgi:hypothetical protein
MARRPHARLITAGFDLHDARCRGTGRVDLSLRTEYRSPNPSLHIAQRVPRIGSLTRQAILCCKRLWQKGRQEFRLRQVAEEQIGHGIKLTMVTVRGKQRWKWRVESIMCLGVCSSLKEARVAAVEKVLAWLGSPSNYAAFQKLAKLTGHEFI